MQLEFGYGSGVQTVELPQENLLGVLHAAPIEHERRGPDAVSWALAHPIGSAPLHALARPGQRIAIVTSDITRPLPSYQILPGVLVSQGGAPKDANLYQTQKALDNAKHAVKDGGTIILVTKSDEGFGSDDTERQIAGYATMLDREKALRENFSIGAFIGYLFAENAEKYHLIAVTGIPQEQFGTAKIHAVKTLDEALELSRKLNGGKDLRTTLLPHGANTLPILE